MLAALTDLVLPADCAGCGGPWPPWCRRCARRLGPPVRGLVRAGPDLVAAGPYAGPARAALLRYKERGRRDLAPSLAALLVPLLPVPHPEFPGFSPPPDGVPRDQEPIWFAAPPLVLVPVPSRRAAVRARGGDHVQRLCRAVTTARPDVAVAPLLRLRRGARDSVGLDARARAANLAGRVVADSPATAGALPEGATVVLVDDVVTTGATLRACRRSLAAAGVVADRALVVCAATGTAR